jgi:hypothetical protein
MIVFVFWIILSNIFIITFSSCLIIKQLYGDVSSSFEPKTTVYMLNDDVNHLQTLITDALRIPVVR